MAKEKLKNMSLLALAIIAGAPAIFGAWIDGLVSSPIASIVFLAIGAWQYFR
jgi:ZIP family zinc transporter